MVKPTIAVRNVSKSFGKRAVLRNVSLDVHTLPGGQSAPELTTPDLLCRKPVPGAERVGIDLRSIPTQCAQLGLMQAIPRAGDGQTGGPSPQKHREEAAFPPSGRSLFQLHQDRFFLVSVPIPEAQ